MKVLKYMKDGGPLSKVWGLFLIEAKSLFSVVLLKFEDGSREAFHTHAFNAVSWVLWGKLVEQQYNGTITVYPPSWRPIYTARTRFHKVTSVGTTWALSFRGPWTTKWREYIPSDDSFLTLTHGRRRVSIA